jgi:hypothetical protein
MPPTILVFSAFLNFLQEGIEKIKDPRGQQFQIQKVAEYTDKSK